MLKRRIATALLTLGFVGAGVAGLSCAAGTKFQDNFNVEKAALTDQGSNTYMILKPGFRLILVDGRVIKLPETVINYAVEITKDGKTAEIVVSPDGTVIESADWNGSEEE